MSLAIHQRDFLYLLSVNRELSYKELEIKLGLSKRSIKLVQESLAGNYGDIFTITASSETLRIDIHKKKEFEKVITQQLLANTNLTSFHRRQAFIFSKLIFSDEYLLADDIADELFISRRTFTRDLTKIKNVAEDYKLIIESKHGVGLRLLGDELDKRLLYLYEVMDRIDDENAVTLPDELEEICKQIVGSQRVPFEVLQLLKKTIRITLMRKANSFKQEELQKFMEYKADSGISSLYLALEYYLNRKLSIQERIFVTFPLNLGLLPIKIWNYQINELTKQILLIVETEFGLYFENEETAELLNTHLIYLINRSLMHWRFTDTSLRDQIAKSAFSTVVAQFFIEQLEKRLDIAIDDSEVTLLSTWFELLFARKSKPLIRKVAIITQGGHSFNMLVEKEVSNFFNSDVEIVFFDSINRPPYQELNSHYDLVFTDNLMFSEESTQPFVSLVTVTKENQMEREQMEHRVLGNHIFKMCNVISVHFDKTKTYKINLILLLKKLKQEKVFDQHFIKKLMEKEGRRASISSEGCAFPHFTNQMNHKITLIVSDESELNLQYENTTVTDFILISVPELLNEEEQDILIKIFDNTFQMGRGTIHEKLGIKYLKERIKKICLQ